MQHEQTSALLYLTTIRARKIFWKFWNDFISPCICGYDGDFRYFEIHLTIIVQQDTLGANAHDGPE